MSHDRIEAARAKVLRHRAAVIEAERDARDPDEDGKAIRRLHTARIAYEGALAHLDQLIARRDS